jgi:hypothetical protein
VNENSFTTILDVFQKYNYKLAREVISTKNKSLTVYLVTLTKHIIDSAYSEAITTKQSPIYKIIDRVIFIEYSYIDIIFENSPYRIFNCHLQYSTSPSHRISQLKSILKRFNSNSYNIVCGDLNSFSNKYFFMLGIFHGYNLKDYAINERNYINNLHFINTFAGMNTVVYKTGQLDYILLPINFRVHSFQIAKNERSKSDHYPINLTCSPCEVSL